MLKKLLGGVFCTLLVLVNSSKGIEIWKSFWCDFIIFIISIAYSVTIFYLQEVVDLICLCFSYYNNKHTWTINTIVTSNSTFICNNRYYVYAARYDAVLYVNALTTTLWQCTCILSVTKYRLVRQHSNCTCKKLHLLLHPFWWKEIY